MTNTNDSFIEEVTEEVRRDKLFGYMRRYGWIAIVAVLALVGGTAFKQWNDAKNAAAAQALGDSIYAAYDLPEVAERADALAALEVSGQATVTKLMLEAATLAELGQTDVAAGQLAAIAADEGFPQVWRDLATLKRIALLGQTLTPEERLGALAPLTTPGAPYRVLAREQEALARYDLGESDEALAIFDELINDQEAPQGLRARAAQMKVVLESMQDDA